MVSNIIIKVEARDEIQAERGFRVWEETGLRGRGREGLKVLSTHQRSAGLVDSAAHEIKTNGRFSF